MFGYESAVVCVHGLEAEELQLGIPQGATTGASSSISLMLFADQVRVRLVDSQALLTHAIQRPPKPYS